MLTKPEALTEQKSRTKLNFYPGGLFKPNLHQMNSEKQSVVREERARRGSNPWMLPALGLDTKSEIVKFYKVLSKRQKHFYRKDSMQD